MSAPIDGGQDVSLSGQIGTVSPPHAREAIDSAGLVRVKTASAARRRRPSAARDIAFTARQQRRAAPEDLKKIVASKRGGMASDRGVSPVFLAKSTWELNYVADKLPK